MSEIRRGPGRPPGARNKNSTFPGVVGQMRRGWNVMRAQAKFRHEEFELTFEEYMQLWEGSWYRKGRANDDLCMTRRDWLGPWRLANVEIVERSIHFVRQGQYRQELRRTLKGL